MTNASGRAMPIIIKGTEVLLPSGEIAPREVAIADGKITAVGTGLEVTAGTRTIDGTGLTLLPGVIDPQVRFRNPDSAHSAHLDSLETKVEADLLRRELCLRARRRDLLSRDALFFRDVQSRDVQSRDARYAAFCNNASCFDR